MLLLPPNLTLIWHTRCLSLSEELLGKLGLLKKHPTADVLFSFKRLQTAFACLSRLASLAAEQFKLYLFIDGLEEYEGDVESIVDLFKDVSMLPYVKVCLSSRPRLVFEDAFRRDPSLRLQDLTYRDIQLYICDSIVRNQIPHYILGGSILL